MSISNRHYPAGVGSMDTFPQQLARSRSASSAAGQPAELDQPVIRWAKQKDVAACQEVVRAAWQHAYPDLLRDAELDDLTEGRLSFDTSWSSDGSSFVGMLVAEVARTVVGFASLGRLATGDGELALFFVLPKAQGHGVGRALWRMACQVLAQQGAPRLQVRTLSRARARRFYERSGCERSGEGSVSIGAHVEAALCYEKRLSKRETLAQAVSEAFGVFSPQTALKWRDVVMSYKEVGAAVEAVAASYRRLGLQIGDRVVCHLPNRPEFLISAMAAWLCGAIHVGADKDLTQSELCSLVALVEPQIVVTRHDINSGGFQPATCPLPSEPHVFICSDNFDSTDPRSFDRLRAADSAAVDVGSSPITGADPAVILVTSGTNASPKAVLRHHGELVQRWSSNLLGQGVASGEAHLVQLPLSHGFGLGLAIGALLTGGRLILMEHFSPDEALNLIVKEGVTILHGAPPHFQLLLDCLEHRSPLDISTLRVGQGSGSGFPIHLAERILKELNIDFLVAYGSSEGLGWATDDPDDFLRGSVGRPPPDRIRITDVDNQTPLAPGRIGEITIRMHGPLRYWKNIREDGSSESDGWHRTGDMGRMDAEGRLYVLGRVTHQIDRGGLWVDSGEVEAAIRSRIPVADVAVIPLPDPVLGEVVAACIVPLGHPPDLDRLRDILLLDLAKSKVPEVLHILPSLPRTQLGKIDRHLLISRFASSTVSTSRSRATISGNARISPRTP